MRLRHVLNDTRTRRLTMKTEPDRIEHLTALSIELACHYEECQPRERLSAREFLDEVFAAPVVTAPAVQNRASEPNLNQGSGGWESVSRRIEHQASTDSENSFEAFVSSVR